MNGRVRSCKAPCSKSTPNAGYMLQIPNHAKPKEVSILCPLRDLAGSCGVQKRVDGGPYQDRGDSKFGGPKEFQTTMCNTSTYMILQKVHQDLCSDYHAHGETVEEGRYILLG